MTLIEIVGNNGSVGRTKLVIARNINRIIMDLETIAKFPQMTEEDKRALRKEIERWTGIRGSVMAA